ncbi:MAG: YdcF family protein, partial [Betaproteobacteria bacterium]
AGIQLALREPGRKLLMSGGSGDSAREADIMADVARAMGVDASRVAVERGSHNTFESAAASARILAAEHAPREVLLVTSALHMVRAVASFETHGLLACPRPMDFRWVSPPASHALIPQASALRKSNDVVHEAAGLAYYRVAGMLSAGSTR